MKGQIFIIIAIIIVLVMILMKTQLDYMRQLEQQRAQLSFALPEIFENIKSEYQRAVQISLGYNKTQTNLENSLNNFSSFATNFYSQRNVSLKVLYSFSFVNSTNLSITLGNFLGKTIQNFSVYQTLTGETLQSPALPNQQSNTTSFTISNQRDFSVTINYFIDNVRYNFTYSSDTSKTTAYFDISLQERASWLSDKLILNLTV